MIRYQIFSQCSPYRFSLLAAILFLISCPVSSFGQAQPTSLTFVPAVGYAGADCYEMTVGNGANMLVDFDYTIDGQPQAVWTNQMDSNGTWRYCLPGNTYVGTYTFNAIKNHLNSTWVSLLPTPFSTPVTFVVAAARPVTLSISPSTVQAGVQNYTMTVGGMTGGNGVYLSVQYRFNSGAVQTILNWPSLGTNSQAVVPVGTCTPVGTTVFTAIKNSLAVDWHDLTTQSPVPQVTVTALPPTVSPNNVGGSQRGTNPFVSFNGSNLCNVSLSTSWPGLSFTNISWSSGSSASAQFNIATSANTGRATVNLIANGGSTTFTFDVTGGATPPTVSAVSPSSGQQGWIGTVTMTGTNLTGATLSTTWSGLTFANVNAPSGGTSLTATFQIAATATVGLPTIRVTTSAGSVNTQLFSVVAASSSASAKEYIYLGDRILAIDVGSGSPPPPDQTPPTAPSNLLGTAAGSSQINLSWTASTDNVGVTGYRLERCQGSACSNFAQIAALAGTGYNDTNLSGTTSYSYRVRATDGAGNLSGYSNIASTTTTGDTQAPTVPSNLAATAVASTQINLSWTASTDNIGVTGYRVERCQGSTCTNFAQIATPTATSYNDTALAPSTTYQYRVRATDAAGNLSGYSGVASASTPAAADTQPPTAPGSLNAIAIGTSQINMTWAAATDNVGVTGYSVERCQGASCTNFAALVNLGTVTGYNNTGLASGTSYRYRVRATDAAGNWSAYSNIATVTTNASTGYQYSRSITINAGQVPSMQSNFPVLVTGTYPYLATVANGGKVQSSTGIDIKFTSDAAGNSPLPYEQERYVAATGEIAYWVKLPSVSAGVSFYVFYGNSSAVDQSNKTAVWDSNFKGVWHAGNTASPVKDSTATVADATAASQGVGFQAAGKIGKAVSLNGSGYLRGPNSPFNFAQTDSFSAFAWIKVASGDDKAVFSNEQVTANDRGWGLYLESGFTPRHIRVHLTNSWGDNQITRRGATDIFDNNWHHIGFTYDGSSMGSGLNIYIDGQLSNGSIGADNLSQTIQSTASLGIGGYIVDSNPGGLLNGTLDEARISNIARSADWILTEYNNQSVPASFYSIGAEAGSQPDTQAPTAPSNLTATAASSTQINLSWTASTDNLGVTGYSVERCQGASCTNFAALVNLGTVTGYNNTGLASGTSYRYRVRATDAAGNWSAYSNIATATTNASSGYQYSRPITINAGKVPSTQSNFPVLVAGTYPYLATVANAGKVQSSTGIDIKFTSDAAGNSLLPYEQERYVAATGEIAYWVKLPSISSGTTFYMFYGNSSPVDQSNKIAVWGTNFKGVWHAGNTASPVKDSTATAADATASSQGVSFQASGKIGKAVSLNGSGYLRGPNSPFNFEQTDSFSAFAWIKVASGDDKAVFSNEQVTANDRGWGLYLESGFTPPHIRVHLTNSWGDNQITRRGATDIFDNNWHHIGFTYDGSSIASGVNVYIDGQLSNGDIGADNLSDSIQSTASLGIGGYIVDSNPGGLVNGALDEARISNIARSADWILTEYNNQSLPASFYSVGAEQ